MEAALRQCTKAASYEECGGSDLTRDYGLTYWLFSTSPMPPSVSRFPDRWSNDGLSDQHFRIDFEDSVFAVNHVHKRCIAVFGDGPEGTDASWDLRRKFGNTADEARQDINPGFPVKAIKCNKR